MSDPMNGQVHSPAPPSSSEAADEINLREYWRILVERRSVVLTCLAVIVAAVMLKTLLTTPEFEATTTLQIERQGPDILTFKDVMGVDPAGYQDFYQTQFKILQSRSVVHLAVERLDLMNRPEFAGRKKAPITRLVAWARSLLRGAEEASADPLEPAVELVTEGLEIKPIRNSHLVKVSFVDRDRMLATEIANAVAAAYQEFNLEARYSTTEQAANFLTKEVVRIQGEIGAAERKLQEYSTRKELLSLGDSAKDISEQALSDLNTRLTEAKGRLALAEARYSEVKTASADSLPEVLNSTLINNLKQQYAEVERRYSQMAERFKSDWPAMQEVQEELDRARERLDIETAAIAFKVRSVAQADYDRARAEVATLQTAVDSQKTEVQRVNRDNIEYSSLKTEIETKRKVLEDLVARQSQTQTSERLRETQASNIRIVDKAEVPKKPVRPKKLLNLAMALFLGITVGVGGALVLDHLDRTIKTEQDIERSAALPILGNVPLFQPLRAVKEGEKLPFDPFQADLASHSDARSAFAEAFKNLRTSFLLASPDRPPRFIVVTSCEPGDGKSTVALNLAIVLTQLGRRVLIVDADLRKPRLHRALSLSNTVGLSSFLTGNARAEELVQETVVPDLDAVTSGPIPPNPSELLDSPSLQGFVDRMREQEAYDHVLFDSPPSVQVADAVILSTKVDGTIVVVRAAKTERDSLSLGAQRLRQARGHVIGAVLNAMPETGGYYYYRYKYYRHYGEEGAATKPKTVRMRTRRPRSKQA